MERFLAVVSNLVLRRLWPIVPMVRTRHLDLLELHMVLCASPKGRYYARDRMLGVQAGSTCKSIFVEVRKVRGRLRPNRTLDEILPGTTKGPP